jgi:hypothetical protein
VSGVNEGSPTLPFKVPVGKSINAPKTPQHSGSVRGRPSPVKKP